MNQDLDLNEELRQKQIALNAWRELAAKYRAALLAILGRLSDSQESQGYRRIVLQALAGDDHRDIYQRMKDNPERPL